jgi:hypothetical protein
LLHHKILEKKEKTLMRPYALIKSSEIKMMKTCISLSVCRALVKAAPAAHIDGRFQKWDWFHRNSCSSLFPVRQKHAVQTGKFD